MEPHTSSITMPTPINSFECKRSHDQQTIVGTDQLPPPKRLCPSPRKRG